MRGCQVSTPKSGLFLVSGGLWSFSSVKRQDDIPIERLRELWPIVQNQWPRRAAAPSLYHRPLQRRASVFRPQPRPTFAQTNRALVPQAPATRRPPDGVGRVGVGPPDGVGIALGPIWQRRHGWWRPLGLRRRCCGGQKDRRGRGEVKTLNGGDTLTPPLTSNTPLDVSGGVLVL